MHVCVRACTHETFACVTRTTRLHVSLCALCASVCCVHYACRHPCMHLRVYTFTYMHVPLNLVCREQNAGPAGPGPALIHAHTPRAVNIGRLMRVYTFTYTYMYMHAGKTLTLPRIHAPLPSPSAHSARLICTTNSRMGRLGRRL